MGGGRELGGKVGGGCWEGGGSLGWWERAGEGAGTEAG